MPMWITLEDQQLQDLAKDAVREVRRTLVDQEKIWLDCDNISLDPEERELLYKYIAEMLTGEFKNGTDNTIRNTT